MNFFRGTLRVGVCVCECECECVCLCLGAHENEVGGSQPSDFLGFCGFLVGLVVGCPFSRLKVQIFFEDSPDKVVFFGG